MTVLYVDTSALLRRYARGADHALVVSSMGDDEPWCASALVRTEVLLGLQLAAAHDLQRERLWRTARDEWDAFWVIPLDARCLARAVEVGATFGLRTVDAIHLAAATRLPAPVRFLTFDRRQIPAAAALGFEVVSPLGD